MRRLSLLCLLIFLSPFIGASVVLAQSDLDRDAFDTSVRIQDDLFLHVNGSWLENTEIPADKSNYGTFIQLDDLSRERMRVLVQEVSKKSSEKGSDEQKVGDFYKSFMDTQQIAAAGFEPLRPELKKIRSIKTKADLFKHFGYLQSIGVSTPSGFFVSQDPKDSSRYVCQLIQSGITLPDRDYYLKDDEKSVAARDALITYIGKAFKLCGIRGAQSTPEQIVNLEKRLAEAYVPRVELRDANKRYNPFEVSELIELTPNLKWKQFFAAVIDKDFKDLNVNTPSYFDGLNEIFDDVSLGVWKNYLRFKLIDSFAPIMFEDLAEAHFNLHSKAVAGIEEQLPRWKKAVNAISGGGAGDFGALGDVVGRLYVARHFPPEAKDEMDKLVKNLLLSLIHISEPTRPY